MQLVSTTMRAAAAAAVLFLPITASAQRGPDVIVGDLTGPANYGRLGNIAAYAIGTTSCNIGDVPLNWFANSTRHPVIAQNVYVLHNDRMRQIGMSWLKHGFTALQQTLCSTCSPTAGTTLGVGCSDPYSAGLNGSQNGLGPRSEVNAATGQFLWPYGGQNATNLLDKRIQINIADLGLAGARYIGEAQYIASDDAAAGNDNNNASYRLAQFNGSYQMSWVGSTVRQRSALSAWKDLDASVNLQYKDVPNDGLFIIASKAVDLGNGRARYEYAIQNLCSDRSGGSVRIQVPLGSTVTNAGFSDIDYHTGEPWDGSDWAINVGADHVSWAVQQSYAQNPNANALRWSTTYNFWFECDQAPGDLVMGLFKPGNPGDPNYVHVTSPYSNRFDLAIDSHGSDFFIAASRVPNGTVLGVTLFTLDTSTAQGAGPLAGITPDPITAALLATGPSAGNPFVWTFPATTGFPKVPAEFPAGTMDPAIGMAVDGVAVGLTAMGAITGQTEVVRLQL